MLPGCPSAGLCLIELLVRPPELENQLGLWSAIQIGRPKFVVHVTMFVVLLYRWETRPKTRDLAFNFYSVFSGKNIN